MTYGFQLAVLNVLGVCDFKILEKNETWKREEQSVLKENMMGPTGLLMAKGRGQSLSKEKGLEILNRGPEAPVTPSPVSPVSAWGAWLGKSCI